MKKLSKRSKKGFTLVELIVVIAILAILAGIAIPVYSNYIKKANEAADLQQLDAIKTAVVFVMTEASIASDETFELTKLEVTASAIKANDTPLTTEELTAVAGYLGQTSFSFTFKSAPNATATLTNGVWKLS